MLHVESSDVILVIESLKQSGDPRLETKTHEGVILPFHLSTRDPKAFE